MSVLYLRRKLSALAVLSLLVLLASCVGAVERGDEKTDGTVTASYVQVPNLGYGGQIIASGRSLPNNGTPPANGLSAVGGGSSLATADTVETVAYAVVTDQDGMFDGLIIYLKSIGPLQVGTYQIDPANSMAAFTFVDDAQMFDVPDTLTVDSARLWLNTVPALHTLNSVSGSIDITKADADSLVGTFSGMAEDVNDDRFTVDFTGGTFTLWQSATSSVPRVETAPTEIRLAPNPFNPRVSISFSLPQEQYVRVSVMDVAGRRVRELHAGFMGEGDQHLTWGGTDTAGRSQSAGTYLMRVEGAGWSRSAKAVLLP